MTIEEKAKRYDEAIKYAHYLINECCKEGTDGSFHRADLDKMFPELKESEGERIRESLLEYLHTLPNHYAHSGVCAPEWIAWLEKQGKNNMGVSEATKQELEDNLHKALGKETPESWNKFLEGEQKPTEWHREDEQNLNVCLGYIPDEYLRRWLKDAIYAKYDKPTDNVEPKFKKGDWVVIQESTYQITKVENLNVTLSLNGKESIFDIDVLKNAHLWTIQDAKDGDVLCCENGWTCIFKTIVNDETFSSYCFMDNTKWFCETGSEGHTLNKAFIKAYNGEIHPATKEQRDLLFQKMHEAGYEWDADAKQLKKVEQKPTDEEMKELLRTEYEKGRADAFAEIQKSWSEEDENHVKSILSTIECCKAQFPNAQAVVEAYNADAEWLKSLKDRVQPQQQKWSKEDEKTLNDIITSMTNLKDSATSDALRDIYNSKIDWLKSLKDKIQPQPKSDWSEEDRKIIIELIGIFESAVDGGQVTFPYRLLKDYIRVLKSCLPQNRWKPSEEQINNK